MRLYFILALFLFQQGVSASPRSDNPSIAQQDGANTTSEKSGNDKRNAKPAPLETKGQATPNSADQNHQRIAPANEPDRVRVISVPEITVARDEPAFYVSLVLAVVGIIGILVAIATLIIVRRQTEATEKAAKASAESVAAINRQIEVMERQTIATERAAEATAQSVVLAADTAQRQLRAYVLVSSALLKFKRPDAPEVQVHFRNYGQTPAYEMRGWISIWIEKYPLTVTLPEAPCDLRKGRETLAPSRISIFVTSKNPPVPPQYIKLLGTPEGTVYVYGEIRYRDAFGTDRWTRYRLMCGGSEPVQTSVTDGYRTALLKPDVEGNEAN